MALFDFEKDELAIGFPEIDKQHKEIVDTLNSMHDLVMADSPDTNWKQEILQSLIQISTLARKHFDYEDALLKKISYPEVARHAAEHQDALNKVLDEISKLNDAGKQSAEDLVSFLKKYVMHHMVKEDSKFVPYVKQYVANQNRAKA